MEGWGTDLNLFLCGPLRHTRQLPALQTGRYWSLAVCCVHLPCPGTCWGRGGEGRERREKQMKFRHQLQSAKSHLLPTCGTRKCSPMLCTGFLPDTKLESLSVSSYWHSTSRSANWWCPAILEKKQNTVTSNLGYRRPGNKGLTQYTDCRPFWNLLTKRGDLHCRLKAVIEKWPANTAIHLPSTLLRGVA